MYPVFFVYIGRKLFFWQIRAMIEFHRTAAILKYDDETGKLNNIPVHKQDHESGKIPFTLLAEELNCAKARNCEDEV